MLKYPEKALRDTFTVQLQSLQLFILIFVFDDEYWPNFGPNCQMPILALTK